MKKSDAGETPSISITTGNPKYAQARSGMRRAKLEGRHIGRPALDLDRAAIVRDRQCGHSLGQIAKAHRVSRATIHKVLHEEMPPETAVQKGLEKTAA